MKPLSLKKLYQLALEFSSRCSLEEYRVLVNFLDFIGQKTLKHGKLKVKN